MYTGHQMNLFVTAAGGLAMTERRRSAFLADAPPFWR
jgi:hypothetical protein